MIGLGLSSASTDVKDGHATELGPLAVPRNMVKGDGGPKGAICRPYGVRKKKQPNGLGHNRVLVDPRSQPRRM